MDGFLISPSEHGCITCFDYPASSCSPLKGTSAVELEGAGAGVGVVGVQILNCTSKLL